MEYTLKRSERRTLSVEITRDAQVIVRAPQRCSQLQIDRFLAGRAEWISNNVEKQKLWLSAHPEPDEAERGELIERAKAELPRRVEYYGQLMNLQPTGLRVTGAKTRFGSCSGRNSLSFSWRLMQYPDAAIDYVVVHELAHIVHKNHGKCFYELIETVFPDWKERRGLLRK